MEQLILPIVESIVNAYDGPSLENVRIIGVQHILETTHAMFQSLYKLGLRPENISILGKCYSTCREVHEEMLRDGIDVSPGSFSYFSHRPFDEFFGEEVQTFLTQCSKDFLEKKYDCVIILDDGGKCIRFFSENIHLSIPMIAIEQTSSGYEAIRYNHLPFPVINVARSPVKLTLESPLIARAAAERLYKSLHQRNISCNKALIIGAGPIGKSIQQTISSDTQVTIYDENKSLSDDRRELSAIIHHFPLIIGCTGKISVSKNVHKLLRPGTALVSVSSSDREFDAVHLRKLIPETQICHTDLMIDDLFLINSGFPVNFDGGRENIEPELIQLTIALIAAGILQARKFENLRPGIIPIDYSMENTIKNLYSNNLKSYTETT